MAIGEGLTDLFRGHLSKTLDESSASVAEPAFFEGAVEGGAMPEMFAGANGKHSLWTCGVPANSVKVVISRARAVLDPSASRACAVLVAGFSGTCAVPRFFSGLLLSRREQGCQNGSDLKSERTDHLWGICCGLASCSSFLSGSFFTLAQRAPDRSRALDMAPNPLGGIQLRRIARQKVQAQAALGRGHK